MKINLIIVLLFLSIFGQAQQQNQMEQLNFMIGDWIGTSTVFSNDTISRQGPAFEKIEYKLDRSIITLDLNSSMLQLHTIIYFDSTDNVFYYCPYSKRNKGKKYKGKIEDGKFIVLMNENYRLVFQQTSEGGFMEYGESLKNNVWTKSFEDLFKKSP